MKCEWEPGDVALVEAGCWANKKVALRVAEGWSHENGVNLDGDGVIDVIRPLVVIDPEDREQVDMLTKALVEAMYAAGDERSAANGVHPATVTAALRSLIEPPKPPEPQGLGAVVEDESGLWWIRHEGDLAPWHRADDSNVDRPWRYFKDITAVRVLSEGVQP